MSLSNAFPKYMDKNINNPSWVAKEVDLKLDGDPVACAWHLHRTNAVPENFCMVLERITEEDRETAVKIRNHFSGKLLLLQLAGKPLTQYRSELLKFLTKDCAYAHEETGMIMSLPRLYEEDMFLDSLKENYNNTPWLASEPHGKEISTTLTFIDSHIKKAFRHSFKQRDSWICYWCHDENDRLYMLEMDLDCPFRNFWQKTIEHPFPVKGLPIKHEAKDGLHYYTLTDWEIL